MKWSPNQARAIDRVATWYRNPHDQVFRLFGYAGSGKTTLAKEFAKGIECGVRFAAFTGKAAHVMTTKGCWDAQTIHQMIYLPREKSAMQLRIAMAQLSALPRTATPQRRAELEQLVAEEKEKVGSPSFIWNPNSEVRNAKLIIIDECSMVGPEVGKDLLRYGVPVLVLGDPAQLPPVKGTGFFTNHEPDVMLSEIHRQAEESPIIRMATDVREGRGLRVGEFGDSRVASKKNLSNDDLMATDQILVGMNRTRVAMNERIRELLKRDTPLPESGDKVVCLRNNHDDGLLNGSLWDVRQSFPSGRYVNMAIVPQDAGQAQNVTAHQHHFTGAECNLDYRKLREAQEFTYGYALTCHKSQGSQWDDVLVWDQSNVFRQDAKRWLYTALTRAAKRVTVAV